MKQRSDYRNCNKIHPLLLRPEVLYKGHLLRACALHFYSEARVDDWWPGAVLVSYCERNKKIEIPDCDNDIHYLTKECEKMFMFNSNVNIQITFQKYDEDWECYVDLDQSYVACNKNKLKLVVTPVLVDFQTPKSSIENVRIFCYHYIFIIYSYKLYIIQFMLCN